MRLERSRGLVERLAADPETGGNLGHRPSIDLVAAHPLVLDLDAVARVEERMAPKDIVADGLGVRMQGPCLAQVLKTIWRTPAPRHHRRVWWRKVRPANRNRPDRTVGPLHRYPVFSPAGLGHHEREAGAPERMERVGDPNLWCFNSTRSILQL